MVEIENLDGEGTSTQLGLNGDVITRRGGIMRTEDLLFWVRAVPFVPFRIRLNSGRTWDIRHPEMVRVSRTQMIIFSYLGEPMDPFEKAEMIGLLLIESIEPIDTPQVA